MIRIFVGAVAGLLIGLACMRSLGLFGLIVSIIMFTGVATTNMSIPLIGIIIGTLVLIGMFILKIVFMI